MHGFSLWAQDWSGFFSTVAQISGSLVGLVFVALTFNPRLLGAGRDPILGILARQTFADFLLLLVVSLVMLTPHLRAVTAGWFILVIAVIDVLRVAVALWQQRAPLLRRESGWTLPQRFIPSFAGHAMLVWAGVELMHFDQATRLGTLLMAGVLMLLLSGCRSAWMLVRHGQE